MKWIVTPGCSLVESAATGAAGIIPANASIIPGDKSISHRAALFAALADGESRFENFQNSGVTRVMLTALSSLGVAWELTGTSLSVWGKGTHGLTTPKQPIDCGNSATTLRLLAGALAAAGIPATLTGSAGLCRRPMDRIVQPLRAMGVSIEASPGDTCPIHLAGRNSHQRLKPIRHMLPVASAQVKTCLLLAALAADGESVLVEPHLSRDHSERMLHKMGVEVTTQGVETRLGAVPSLRLQPLRMTIPGDISAAAFLIVAGLITPGSRIGLRDVGLNPTRTGILDALGKMGAAIEITHTADRDGEPVGDILVQYSRLQGIDVSGGLVVRMIDEFPAFAVAAAYAEGITRVEQASELRCKESDRIARLCAGLKRLGAEVMETPDGFVIQGGQRLNGGCVDSSGDHRLAMAFTIAGLAADAPVSVTGVEAVSESFPSFSAALRTFGLQIEEEE